MSSEPMEMNDKLREEYYARWEAVERVKAQELAGMTEERAREIMRGLGAVDAWRAQPHWSGLVEQQAIFLRGRRK
jgi:hypothetical protein